MAQARLLQAQGEGEYAHTLLSQAVNVAREHDSSLLIHHIAAQQARLWLAQGQITSALSWAEHCTFSVGDTSDYVHEFEYLTLARIFLTQGKAKEVVGLLERLRRAAVDGGRTGTVIEILLLQALANYVLHQQVEAFAALERVLALAEPEEYMRLFLDEGTLAAQLLTKFIEQQSSTAKNIYTYASSILNAFVASASMSLDLSLKKETKQHGQMPFMEQLGERETEALHYLAAGLSNQAIAEQMVVAVSTVKSHLKSIYRKLDVSSRTHAVARARELHLL